MDELFDLDLYSDPLSAQKQRGSAEQSTAALIASSMNSEYTDYWTHRQDQMHNHLVQAPSLVQLGQSSYRPTSNRALNDSSSGCSANVNEVGSFGIPDELSLPPLRAPTENIIFLPQYSNLNNYSNLDAFGGEGDPRKNNGAFTYGNNGSIAYGDNGVLGSSVCHELQRIDGPTENAFMGIPVPSRKGYVEDTPYYTDLEVFKPIEEAPKNSDGSFLSPSIEVNDQYSPNDQLNVGDAPSSMKKVKSPRKTPSKKRKGVSNENPVGQNSTSDSSIVNDYSGFNEIPNYVDGTLPFPSSCNDSNNLAFPLYPMKPESTTLNRGKVKSPRKTPSKKKKAPIVNYSGSTDGSSLAIKAKCEKSIGTDNAVCFVSGATVERLSSSPATHTATTAGDSSIREKNEDLGCIKPADLPEPTSSVGENKTEPVPTPDRDPTLCESLPMVPSEGKALKLPAALPGKEVPPPSTSKTKLPTAKAPSYLTGFPMRCPEYPIVYCCNHCARIFTSIRGGQLHECVKKRPGRKAGIKLQ